MMKTSVQVMFFGPRPHQRCGSCCLSSLLPNTSRGTVFRTQTSIIGYLDPLSTTLALSGASVGNSHLQDAV